MVAVILGTPHQRRFSSCGSDVFWPRETGVDDKPVEHRLFAYMRAAVAFREYHCDEPFTTALLSNLMNTSLLGQVVP